ncbi:MAG: cysteine desulfurase [Methanomethylophilus sp.]|nr:cysteine desulfurase [Methanomethylophilus sp.]
MDFESVRNDFPTMRTDKGVYLDSSCQSLRPDSVIEAVTEYYEKYPVCGGRSVHHLANEVSIRVDETREALVSFFNAESPNSFVFTKNSTEALNTVAFGFGLKKGDAVVTTDSEHNSNYVPWLTLKDSVGINLRRSESGQDGVFDIEAFKNTMGKDVKLVSVTQCSNVTGCTVPIKDVAEIAHDYGAKIMVDGAQGAPHIKVDLKDCGVDFYATSIHKMLGPSGMGFLYGTEESLEALRPSRYGGGMVGLVTYSDVDYAPVPDRLEAGLQDYAGIFGTKAAIDYLSRIGMEEVMKHDAELVRYMYDVTRDIKGLHIVGPEDPSQRCSLMSFNIDGLGAHDVAMMLDSMDGIMVRSGMHCAHPFFVARGVEGSVRASVYLYNNRSDIDRLAAALTKISETFGE